MKVENRLVNETITTQVAVEKFIVEIDKSEAEIVMSALDYIAATGRDGKDSDWVLILGDDGSKYAMDEESSKKADQLYGILRNAGARQGNHVRSKV